MFNYWDLLNLDLRDFETWYKEAEYQKVKDDISEFNRMMDSRSNKKALNRRTIILNHSVKHWEKIVDGI